MAVLDEPPHEFRPDQPGTADYHDLHREPLPRCPAGCVRHPVASSDRTTRRAVTATAGFLVPVTHRDAALSQLTRPTEERRRAGDEHRLLTMVQMAGVLVLAAGVPAAADGDYLAVTAGYLVMRLGLVSQWLRAGVEDRARRRTAVRYATGIGVMQVGWVARLVLAEAGALSAIGQPLSFVGLAVAELAVPRWAERPGPTNWHPHHIAERYGLFTIILLGESVLAAITGVRGALESAAIGGSFVTIAVCGLVLLFALWWLYFLEPAGEGLADRRRRSYLWGYGHYGIFAALAVLGAGLEVALPTGVFLVLLWLVTVPLVPRPVVRVVLSCATVVLLLPLAAPFTGVAPVVAGIAASCALLVAYTIASARNRFA
ncbi:low temperature requirement protein A [Actinophytocola sp. NPDC049390]|uniref:low temperature requirement protein A n=1 Tax=Actinophytocola sp. NPDC049390 TaxID=3363894 RepID=UPI00379D305A